MPKNVVEVLAALDRLFLVLRHHQVLGAPDAVFVDVGQVFTDGDLSKVVIAYEWIYMSKRFIKKFVGYGYFSLGRKSI